jgi:hypothetical protein
MTQRTISESIFESLCLDLGIPCTSIPREDGKTPDFDIELGGNTVVVEVKQLDPNERDKAVFEHARRTGTASGFCASDNRIRRKINDASTQLKARSGGRLPTMVVLFDNGTFDGIDYTDIKTAMFGDEKVVVTFVNRETQHVTPIHPGGGRRMSETCNTSIGAVALLFGSIANAQLSVFHNHFAAIPIDPSWCQYDRVRQFALASDCYEWSVV